MSGDQAELERRAGEYLQVQGAVGSEGTGKTRYGGRLPDGLRDEMMEGIALGVAALQHMVDFLPDWAIGDPVDGPPFGKVRPFPTDDNLIECTDYHELPELPPEQVLLPPVEEAEDE